MPRLCVSIPFPLLLAVHTAPVGATDWIRDDLTAGRSPGLSSVAFTPAGMPAIAHGFGAIYYAEWNGTSWDTRLVDEGACLGTLDQPSLAFAADGRPAIAYRDPENGVIKYAHEDASGGFAIEVVAAAVTSSSGQGRLVSLKFDPSGAALISFFSGSATAQLSLARHTGAAWMVEAIDAISSAGGYNSLAIDGAGRPAVAYAGDQGLALARWNGAAWVREVIDAVAAKYPSLAFDHLGQPFLSYSSSALKLARGSATGWTIEDVDASSLGWYSELAVHPSGRPVISYCKLCAQTQTSTQLDLALWLGSSWQRWRIDSADFTGWYTSIAVAPSGEGIIGYFELSPSPTFTLRIARSASFTNLTTWTRETLEPTAQAGDSNAIAVDPGGDLLVAWGDHGNQQVGFSRFDGTTWSSEVVAAAKGWQGVSVAADATGLPGISYVAADGVIAYAHFDGSAWTTEPTNDAAVVGRYPSLALDAWYQPAIVYDDGYNRGIAVARRSGAGTWTTEIVTPLRGKPALRLDPTGVLAFAVAWDSSGSGGVRFVRQNGAGWAQQTVPSADAPCAAAALSYDASGRPHISFSERISGPPSLARLRLASWTGSSWSVATIATFTAAEVPTTSIAFDRLGNPAVAYQVLSYSPPSARDYLARRSGASWTHELIDDASFHAQIALTFDADGEPALSYGAHCLGGRARVARVGRCEATAALVGASEICAGETMTADATASRVDCPQGATAVYQWRLDGSDVPGATVPTYTTDPGLARGDHFLDLDLSCDPPATCQTSLPSPLHVHVSQPIAAIAGATRVCAGEVATFDGNGSTRDCPGPDALTYQWRLDGIDIPGATTATWSSDPGLSIGLHDLSLRVQCTAAPTCGDVLDVPFGFEVVDAAACCVSPPGVARGLVGAKDYAVSPPRDIHWRWAPEGASAAGYRLYAVANKRDLAQARAPFSVPRCATPTNGSVTCAESDALTTSTRWFYNLVGACGGGEGP